MSLNFVLRPLCGGERVVHQWSTCQLHARTNTGDFFDRDGDESIDSRPRQQGGVDIRFDGDQ